MADYKGIANNQHMVTIANAIRAVTRTTGRMTIPEMPERLLNIQVVETRDIDADFSEGTEISLGTYDTAIRHLFIVSPKTTADAKALAKTKTEIELQYSDEEGELVLTFSRQGASSINLKVLDLLLASTETSSGFVVNLGTGGSGDIEAYDSTKDYEIGELFTYEGMLSMTTVPHGAEAYNPAHNVVLARQVYDNTGLQYRDLAYYAELIETKLDKASVKNERSDSKEEVYSADYANKSFAPLALAQPFYAARTDDTHATLQKNPPAPAAGNILTKTTTNTAYDWQSPDFTFSLTLTTAVVLSKGNSFTITLPFRVDRNESISFGARVKISTDNGQTWTYISSEQAYGSQDFTEGQGNTVMFAISFDELTDLTTYEAGTLVQVEIYKKQTSAQALTTTVYCGVEVDGAIINTTVQFIVASIGIDTQQIEDGAVTLRKLSPDLQYKMNNALLKPATTPTEDTVTYVDSDGTQQYAELGNNLEVRSGTLVAGIEIEEVR